MQTKWIALATAALLTPTSAQAQQPNPAFSWSGFYVGVNAGSAWGRYGTTTGVPCSGGGGYLCPNPPDDQLVSAAGTGSISGSGFTGGVQAGYNWQSSNIVYGLEVDFGAFNIRATRRTTAPFFFVPANLFTITNSADTDWLFTARGRFGWVFSNVLVYGTGGLAVARIDTANSYSDNVFPAPMAVTGNWNASKTKLGWVFGGGFELPIAKNWTVKAEYLYLDFGSIHAAGTISGGGGFGYSQAINTSTDLTAHIARAGVNFRF